MELLLFWCQLLRELPSYLADVVVVVVAVVYCDKCAEFSDINVQAFDGNGNGNGNDNGNTHLHQHIVYCLQTNQSN